MTVDVYLGTNHIELKPYSCPICYKGFVRKDNLKRHTATECHKSFGKKTSQKSVKVPKACKFCKKEFFDISTLKRHCKNFQWQNWQHLLQNAENWTTWWKTTCHLEPTA